MSIRLSRIYVNRKPAGSVFLARGLQYFGFPAIVDVD